jgi:hypothetical protein
MWKSLSIKSQLILILLIPISGLIYMTISNIRSSLDNYKVIDSSIESIKNIALLSNGISMISNERGLNDYTYYDASKKGFFLEEKQKTNDWFLKANVNDSIVFKNLKSLQTSLLRLQSNIESEVESPSTAFVKYTSINETLNNLIEREIINCESSELTKLANNYYNYVILKEAVLLKRAVVLQTLIDDKKNENLDNSLLELYFKAKNHERVVEFKLINFRLDDLNKDLVKFKNSVIVSSFNINSELIIENKLELSPDLWWEKSSTIISKFENLEDDNLRFILNFANKEKQSALKSIIVLISILS